MSRRLFEAAGVGFGVAEPLVRAAVENALALGPEAALTGPVARGDAGTVAAQVAAVRHGAPDLAEAFIALARAAAHIAGTEDAIEEALRVRVDGHLRRDPGSSTGGSWPWSPPWASSTRATWR